MDKIKVEKVPVWKAPDGTYHETKESCETAVRRAVIVDEMKQSFSGGEIWVDEVINVVHNKWDLIQRRVQDIMGGR